MSVIFALLLCQIPDGSLLFVENGSNLVERYTKSSFSHVAIVIDEQVYEADVPEIRKMTLEEWYAKIAKYNEGKKSAALVTVMAPDDLEPFQIEKMRKFLDDQVGRRYSIRGYLRKIPGDGIHCSEMVSMALEEVGFEFSEENFRISPGELFDELKGYHQLGEKLYLKMKQRTSVVRRWGRWWANKGAACRWSCFETWTFCW